jgi:hypothetical protein
MSLYPDILFHFTQKEWLYEILRSTFKISYAKEKITGINNSREFAVPMVSFCDLKLSELKTHIEKYGDYGIGLTKEWANKKGLSPVMYINKNSEITDNLTSGLSGIYRFLNKIDDINQFDSLNQNYLNILNLYRYIKNYEGELNRPDIKDDNYRFAEEREWRYVPSIHTKNVQPFIPVSKIRTKKQKIEFNNSINHLRLSFEPNDIKYLIVKTDKEIQGLIRHLHSVKNKFNTETLNRLASRILTVEQIKSDI